VVFFVQHGSFEPGFQLASMAVTAAAMGDEVIIVFAFDALRQLVQKSFGKPATDRENAESARGEGLGLQTPMKLLEEARKLGARLVACDTTVKLCGLAERTGGALDETMGLASIWRLAQGARVVSL
jgi:peroxiredoxin family protein